MISELMQTQIIQKHENNRLLCCMRPDSDGCMSVSCVLCVCVHTLGLGNHFSSAAPPAVHHGSTGSTHAARALSPGTNTAWRSRRGGREEHV